jgi:hypothetical protein
MRVAASAGWKSGPGVENNVASYTVSAAPRHVGWVAPSAWSGWWDPWYGPRIAVGLRFGATYYYRPFFGRVWGPGNGVAFPRSSSGKEALHRQGLSLSRVT